jgi:hypothetical protein
MQLALLLYFVIKQFLLTNKKYMEKSTKVSVFAALCVVGLIGVITVFATGKLGRIRTDIKSQSASAISADLSTADNFAVLAGSGITNTGSTNVIGDIGSYPTLDQVGFGPGADSVTITGTNHNGDAIAQTAKDDLVTAYNTAMGQTPTGTIAADLGGQTLTPGVYKDNGAPASLGISGTLTLDAKGDSNAVFIFQSASTLITAPGSIVSLVNGAQPCNVIWQVGSSATLGTNSTFVGNILALASITDSGGSTVNGRLLARNASVTLNNTTITVPTCTATTSYSLQPAPELTVIKVVVNNGVGTKAISDFPLFIDQNSVVSGIANTTTAGSHTVSETSDSNYTSAITGDCATDGTISLSLGDVKICTITNSYITQGSTTASSTSSGSGGGSGYITPPLISVIKVPNPLALPNGPGLITYTYTLHNTGIVPVNNITMIDDSCSPVTFVSGDINGNSKLDLNETWTYNCATTLSTTHTNTVTATGWA